jgi:sulfide:quinone oxidoreductase
MKEPMPLTDDISVSAFVPPKKLPELAPKFRTIINNRPDNEEPGQPSSAEIEAEARRLGIDYIHIPVTPGQIDDEKIAAFGSAISTKNGPVLAFCRSGQRSVTLWALSQAGKRSVDQILRAATDAGYDLSALRAKLQEKATAA